MIFFFISLLAILQSQASTESIQPNDRTDVIVQSVETANGYDVQIYYKDSGKIETIGSVTFAEVKKAKAALKLKLDIDEEGDDARCGQANTNFIVKLLFGGAGLYLAGPPGALIGLAVGYWYVDTYFESPFNKEEDTKNLASEYNVKAMKIFEALNKKEVTQVDLPLSDIKWILEKSIAHLKTAP